MSNKSSLVTIRDGVSEDLPFIFSTWLKGLRFGNSWFEAIDQETYFKRYHQILSALLNSPGVTVKVACLTEDSDVVLGYSVYSGTKLHWVFCKKAWRNNGLAKSLVPDTITKVTHLTATGKSLLSKRPGVTFDPFDIP